MSDGETDRLALFRKAAFSHLADRFPRVDESLQKRLKEQLSKRQVEMNTELKACLKKHQNDVEGSLACSASLDRSQMTKLRQRLDAHKLELHACFEGAYQSFAAKTDMRQEAAEAQLLGCLDAFESSLAGKLYN